MEVTKVDKTLGKILSNVTTLGLIQSIFKYVKNKIKEELFDNFVVYENDDLYGYLEGYLYDHYPKIGGLTEAHVGGAPATLSNSTEKTDGLSPIKQVNVAYRKVQGDFNIVYKGRRIYISKNREKLEKAESVYTMFHNSYTLSAIDGSTYIKGFLKEVTAYAIKKINKQQIFIYTHSTDGYWYQSNTVRYRDIKSIILPREIINRLVTDIDEFVTSKQWYNDRGIPYKRSYLLTGPPGNGKSSLATALSGYLDRSIYVLNLASLRTDADLRQAFSNVPDHSILLLEDIDSVLGGRKVIAEGTKITFSGILNVLDGVFYKEGLLTIVTTNHQELLDQAFTRKGRMDQTFEIPNPGIKEIELYLEMFYGEPVVWFKELVLTKQIPMSEIQDICIRNKNDITAALKEINKKIK